MRSTRRPRSSTALPFAPFILPKPRLGRGRPLRDAFKRRMTSRDISERRLPLRLVSNLLWAACGVNRRKGPFGTPGITAASASNSQEILVFVALQQGAYLFDATQHSLLPVSESDLRELAIGPGQRRSVRMSAPIELVYVVDLDRLVHTKGFQEPGLHDPEVQKSYYFVDTGLIAGNVYLFASSFGLAVWFHNCDRESLAKALNLRPTQRALFAQSVGYPA